MYVLNESAPYEAYKAFDELLRKSKLRDAAGTIILSTDSATLEIEAAFKTLESSWPPRALARARTAQALFAQVLLILASWGG